jgi:RNA polymerase subunit RPABC4/transcription elongation factor Spt4
MPLTWFFFCGVVAYFASERGRNPVLWGLLAVVISPILAGLFLVLMKDLSVEEEIDELDKKTENIQREVKSNQEYNEQEREQLKKQLGAGEETNTDDKLDGETSSQALEAGKIECLECGEYITEAANYCVHCGAEATEIKCPECARTIDQEAKFCPDCGTELAGS